MGTRIKQVQSRRDGEAGLSAREFQVLRLLGTGYTFTEIADELALCASTVRTYKARVYRKMGFENGRIRSATTWRRAGAGSGEIRSAATRTAKSRQVHLQNQRFGYKFRRFVYRQTRIFFVGCKQRPHSSGRGGCEETLLKAHNTMFPCSRLTILYQTARLVKILPILGALFLLGCREDLVLPETVEQPFSLYGVLSPDLGTQSILVFPVENRLRQRAPEPLDAVVTSTDLTTGEVRVWKDSLTVDSLGQYDHVYWSDFRAEHGHTYRVEAVRSDGAKSFVEVSVPQEVTYNLEDTGRAIQPVLIRGEGMRLHDVAVHYRVRFYNPWYIPTLEHAPPDFDSLATPFHYTYVFPYAGEERKVADGWEIDVRMADDFFVIQGLWQDETNYDLHRTAHPFDDDGLVFISMEVHALVADEAWNPPGGVFDPEVLSDPGAMTNVQGGFGFVGAGYRLDERVFPSQAALEAAGFYYIPWLMII